MAFIRKSDILKSNSITQTATSVKDNKVSIPMVFIKEKNTYHGFVPGYVMNDIVDEDLNTCQNKLLKQVKVMTLKKIKNNEPFPFFPTNDEIKETFKGIVLIKRISVKIK